MEAPGDHGGSVVEHPLPGGIEDDVHGCNSMMVGLLRPVGTAGRAMQADQNCAEQQSQG